ISATLNSEAAIRGKNTVREDVYPPLWDSVPENLLDFPVEGDKIVINAWNYRERLGAYKTLLNASAKYFSPFGSQNFANILWGLALQHGWQFHTGRLADPSSVTSCGYQAGDLLCISIRSWWACMNYYLSMIPFLGAVEAGLFGELPYEIEIIPPEELREDFCYSVADCRSRIPKLMDEWKAYFEIPTTESSFSLDDALHHMWKAHVASIAHALPKLIYLSDPEANFGEDWANGVDFIAATHFSTDLWNTHHFQAFLPQRMLVEGDVIPFIHDFSPQQNKVLFSLSALYNTNKLTGGLLLKLWRKAMSTEAGRELGRKMIEDLVASQEFNPMEIYDDVKGGDLAAPSFLTKNSISID
uniref:LEG1H protein n=1 Tax=Nothoprocta perdicaria TaxID=30464 RepID=A0A8C6ZTH2_NOTPE